MVKKKETREDNILPCSCGHKKFIIKFFKTVKAKVHPFYFTCEKCGYPYETNELTKLLENVKEKK